MSHTTAAILIHRHGGPEVLEHSEMEVRELRPDEVLIRQSATGLNFADVYQRKGQSGPHEAKPFPIVLGSNGAGVVEAVGNDVQHVRTGDVVGFVHPGAYAKVIVAPESRVVLLPATIPAELAAANLLRGLTAEYLLHRLFTVRPGTRMLIHAAAGGMGTLLAQWGKALGAYVIGTVGSEAKQAIASSSGCDAVINYSTEDFVARTRELTSGQGVDVVYDAVGKSVFVASLECLRPMGMAINYGAASGPVGAFDIQLLHHKSLIVSRPTLRTYIATRELLSASAATFFAAVTAGAVRLDVSRRYQWSDVRTAHEDLEGRRSTGAMVLVP